MQPIWYTDTDKIRSVLGVSQKELDDARIIDRDLGKELRLDLLKWIPTHAALYTDGTSSGASEEALSISDALVLYSTYFCSLLTVKALKLIALHDISDGKNSMSRFATMDWQALQIDLQERVAFYKSLLSDLTAPSATAVAAYNPFTAVGLAVDPVTSTQ